MASDTENKPFRCNFQGCHQKFANVDRLNVHQEAHKQENALKLKMGLVKTADQLVDQTPTPTRFLKNCDEEGVFENLNPLEEEMKARLSATAAGESVHEEGPSAVETLAAVASAVSASTSPSHSTTEMLGSSPSSLSLTSPNAAGENRSIATTQSFFSPGVVVPVPPPASIANPDASIPMAVAPTNLVQRPSATGATPPSKHGTVAPNTKKRLQEALSRQHGAPVRESSDLKRASSPPMLIMPSRATVQSTPIQPAPKLLPKPAPTLEVAAPITLVPIGNVGSDMAGSPTSVGDTSASSPSSMSDLTTKPGRRRRTGEDLDPAEKRARFLQRNREAATRCREKRKHWIQTLEKRSQELARQNAQLQSEVVSLRNERAHLKLLLLSHKDCPVTIQQQKQLTAVTSQQANASTSQQSTPTATTTATSAAVTLAGVPAPAAISSPITPLVMFPLTPDGLQVAAAAAAATPTIDLNTLNFLQQFQQASQQSGQQQQQQQQSSQQQTTQPSTPGVPIASAQQLQALIPLAQHISLLQLFQQQQQQQQSQQQLNDSQGSEGPPSPSDGSMSANGNDDVPVVEISI